MNSYRVMLLILLVGACSFLQTPVCQANVKLYDAVTAAKVRDLEPWMQDLVSKIKNSSFYSELSDQLEDTNVVWKFKVTTTGEFLDYKNCLSTSTSEKEAIVLNLLKGISMNVPPNNLAVERGLVVRVCKEKGKAAVFVHIGHDPHAKLAQ